MTQTRTIRFIEPMTRPGRPYNAWIQRWPLLGPVTLATVLHAKGFDAGICNENVSGPVEQNAPAWADIRSADVVGISIMTPTASRGYAIADRLRAEGCRATIVLGGVHATFMSTEAAAHSDVVVQGEGENVIEAIARGDITHGIVPSTPVADLDSIPPLNYFLMHDFEKLIATQRRRELYELPMATSRGCPYGCTYCSVTRMFGRKVRRQSVDKVISDLRHHIAQGFERVFFYDDNFLADRAWAREVLERMRPLKMRFNLQGRVDFHWTSPARSEHDLPLLRAIRRAGPNVIYVGYETIDDATAKAWNKGYRGNRPLAQRLAEDTRALHEAGLWIHGMFVLGPQHTQQTADGIVQFARSQQIETLQITILTPFPGTPLLGQMAPNLIVQDFPRDWDYFDGAHCVFGNSRMGFERMQQAVFEAHCRFYRLGGWSVRRIRALLEEPLSLRDKVARLWGNAKIARPTLANWKTEIAAYVDYVRAKTNLANL
ncbi:MAG: B12-binding domain-containing radical SAM protein [Planctomycetaceae bacterium]|nr:B12-binding domain-containing radical SAM protein [Planctomycetaceae bacterium]